MMGVGGETIHCARAFAIFVITTGVFLEARMGSRAAQEQSARLRVGETLRVSGTETSLTVVSVPLDSRCPKGARCIRAGEAVVVLRVREENGDALSLRFEVPPDGGVSQSFRGYQIRVDRLGPQVETDVEIAPSD